MLGTSVDNLILGHTTFVWDGEDIPDQELYHNEPYTALVITVSDQDDFVVLTMNDTVAAYEFRYVPGPLDYTKVLMNPFGLQYFTDPALRNWTCPILEVSTGWGRYHGVLPIDRSLDGVYVHDLN